MLCLYLLEEEEEEEVVVEESRAMLVLFETPAGFALFKLLDEGKLEKVEVNWKLCSDIFSSF